MPDENIIYFGDTGRNPYGVRPQEELRRMARQDMELAAALGAKAIIAACGTVSSTAPDVLAGFRLPVYNVIDASVKKLAAVPGDAPLGVIATSASIKSGAFRRRLEALCPGREIVDIACQDFVRLVETGHTAAGDEQLAAAAEEYLAPMREKGVCALLLGCTHFDFAADAIRKCLGGAALVSAAGCAAESMCAYLEEALSFTPAATPRNSPRTPRGCLDTALRGMCTPRAPTVWRTEHDERRCDLHAQHRGL